MGYSPITETCGAGRNVCFEIISQDLLDLTPGITEVKGVQLVTSGKFVRNCCRCLDLPDRKCDVGSANGDLRQQNRFIFL